MDDVNKIQDAPDTKAPVPKEASPVQIAQKPLRVLENLSSLEFHDAIKFEKESMRGPETANSAGSIASSQKQVLGNYREGARVSPFTIEGISPLVPLAQEPLGSDLWVHLEPLSPPQSYLFRKVNV